ncbi:MAG: YerC/YecD family TrpR-related protein [Clostridia bacterium]|nr:YerC/YecD family TrpR-related protein [Clostridia bacterium]
MSEKIKDENIDTLFRAILSLKDIQECYDFFEDVCTVSEIKEMSKRLLAAKLLSENCIYTDIAKRTGLSTATISRVNRSLKYGNDGYMRMLERLSKEEK